MSEAPVIPENPDKVERTNDLSVTYITMQFPVPSETFACNDVRGLTKRGVEITAHSLRGEHPEAEKLLRERDIIEVGRTHSTPASLLRGLVFGLTHPFLFASFLSWIVRTNWRKPEHLLKSLLLVPRTLDVYAQVERDKPDVVHIYWGHYPSMVGYLVKRYLPKIKVTLSLVAYDLTMEYEGSKVVAQQADAVRTLSNANLEEVTSIYGVPKERIEVIYDGVDLTRIQNKLAETNLKRVKVPKRVLSVGRLVKRKGMAKVLDAFASVSEQHSDATLVILGDGEERQALEAQSRSLGIEHAVEFKGHVNHDTVFEEMAQAEVFLFMSYAPDERLPNAVKEAMLCECVCVVSDTVGIRELIPDDSYGYVVEDVEQASAAVLNVFQQGQELTTPLVDKASRRITERLSVETSVSQYIELWERVSRETQT